MARKSSWVTRTTCWAGIPAFNYPTVIDFYNWDVVVPDGTGEELETEYERIGIYQKTVH